MAQGRTISTIHGLRAFSCAIAGLALAACSAVEPDGGGGRAQANMPSILSINPCTDALLVEIAEPSQILAISHYSHDTRSSSIQPDLAARFAKTGGTVEEILALNPDIVIGGSFMPPATRHALEDLGLRVETFGIASTVDESKDQIRRMALITGGEGAADALIARIDAALESAQPGDDEHLVATLLWQPGQIVPGGSTLISDLMRHAGLASHSEARGLAQADYLPLENILADPPSLLLIAGNEKGQQHPVLEHLPNMRAETFDPALLYCAGPTIIPAVTRLAELRKGAQ